MTLRPGRVLVLVFLWGGGLFFLLPGIGVLNDERRIEGSGIPIAGTVVDRGLHVGLEHDDGKSSDCYLLVEYVPASDGALKTHKAFRVSRQLFERTPNGSTVRLRHLPANPDEILLEGGERLGIPMIVIGAVLLTLGVLTWLLPRVLAKRKAGGRE
jgi:uncharacterized protein DUF3592